MKLFVTLATLVGFATAACPNSCSGHGTCDHYDACTCFKETPLDDADFKGTIEVEWTGADCSRRTCPRGISWSKSSLEIDTNAIVVTNSKNVDWKTTLAAGDKDITLAGPVEITFTWTGSHSVLQFATLADFTNCETTKATTLATVSPYVFKTSVNDVYYFGCGIGAHCKTNNQKTKLTVNAAPYVPVADTNLRCRHQPERECSDQGLCDRATGLCSCFPGYTGSSCQRTGCPDDCSGHGSCRSNRDFAYDWAVAKTTQMQSDRTSEKDWTERFKETYFATYDDAWDSNMHWGCLCDEGYRGPSCALVECPSSTDPLDDKCDTTPGVAKSRITDYQLQYDAPFGGDGWEQAYSLEAGKAGEQLDLSKSDFNHQYILDNNGRKVYGCYGSMSGQDCSGRGICDYSSGTCKCFSGYAGTACEKVEEMS